MSSSSFAISQIATSICRSSKEQLAGPFQSSLARCKGSEPFTYDAEWWSHPDCYQWIVVLEQYADERTIETRSIQSFDWMNWDHHHRRLTSCCHRTCWPLWCPSENISSDVRDVREWLVLWASSVFDPSWHFPWPCLAWGNDGIDTLCIDFSCRYWSRIYPRRNTVEGYLVWYFVWKSPECISLTNDQTIRQVWTHLTTLAGNDTVMHSGSVIEADSTRNRWRVGVFLSLDLYDPGRDWRRSMN